MRQAKAPRPRKTRQRDSRVTERFRYRDFLTPRYWGPWLFIGFMHCIGRLSERGRVRVARWLTPILMTLVRSRRHVADRNLRLCFPDLSETEHRQLLKRSFFSYILGMLETARSWVKPMEPMRDKVRWEGLEHLDAAQQQGKGVLLVGGHFTILDMAGALFGLIREYDLIYRKHDNELLNYFMTRSRERWCSRSIARRDMRGLIRSLREGRIVWYAPDQDYGRKASTFVPFFNIPTATVTMTTKLAKSSGAAVVPVFFYRDEDPCRYVARFEPALPIPSDDEDADARVFNEWLEAKVREQPEQYLWLHKRFKTRPEGEPSVY